MESKEFYELKYPGDTLSVHTGNSEAILALQKFLNARGYTDAYGRPLAEDGIYGKNTFNAVIKYQEANGLFGDGIVGDKTWNSMYETIKNEEFNNAATSGNVNAYYADSELNTEDMEPYMYRTPKDKNSSVWTNIGKTVGAINNYIKASNEQPEKAYSDGWEESEEKEKEIEETNKDRDLVTPEGNFMKEEDADFISRFGENAWHSLQ